MPYEFSQDDFMRFQTEVLGAEGDQATLTSLLTDMQNTFSTALAKVNETTAANVKLSETNQRLQESNMSLFLKIGEQEKMIQENGGVVDVHDKSESLDEERTPVKDYFNRFYSKGEK